MASPYYPPHREVNENVYALLPQPVVEPQREKMHRSKFPPTTPPTASTFGASTASQYLATNLSGEYSPIRLNHPHRKTGAHWGPKSPHFSDTTNFLKKRSKTGDLPPATSFRYSGERKAPVLGRRELAATQPASAAARKNFVAENALAVITAEAKKPLSREVNYLKKAEFGRVPSYLDSVKSEIADEQKYIQQMVAAQREEQLRHHPRLQLLPEEERQRLLVNLKKKWELVNKQYQMQSHIVTLDTIGKIRRKEQYETELQQIEKSIEKLSKKYVFVHDDASGHFTGLPSQPSLSP